MSYKTLFLGLLIGTQCYANALTLDNKLLNGNWHLRVIDGMEVRKARAILDFNTKKMTISGFDSCNRISGIIQTNSSYSGYIPMLRTTRMACRNRTNSWVSIRLHKTLKEGFTISKAYKYGVHGIMIKSPSHELFLKKMGKKL